MTPMSLVEPVQRASLAGSHVSGQLNRLLNAPGLVRRDISTVEIARDRGARNAGQLGHIFHLYLLRFSDWLIDREWLNEVFAEQQQEVLNAEALSPDGLVELINRAASLGFVVSSRRLASLACSLPLPRSF